MADTVVILVSSFGLYLGAISVGVDGNVLTASVFKYERRTIHKLFEMNKSFMDTERLSRPSATGTVARFSESDSFLTTTDLVHRWRRTCLRERQVWVDRHAKDRRPSHTASPSS